MNIALPILLLVFGGLTFWILNESSLKWYIRAACISAFCVFTIIFWSSIYSFLGWAANEDDMPEKVLIHWVIIKEPNKFMQFDGKIYVLLESVEEPETNRLLMFFGHNEDVMLKLRKGQPVVGRLTKKGGKGKKDKKGKRKPDEKGDGSESQEQEWRFHELLPSEIHQKPER